MNKAIFMDRDGTIIEEKGYICHFCESKLFPFTSEALRRMKKNGYLAIVITNQSSIGRGICSKEQVEQLHEDLKKELEIEDAVLDGIYYSPFHDDAILEEYRHKNHWLRKPSPGMLKQAASEWDIDLSRSFMIGDDLTDILAGKNAGCRTVLVLTGKGNDTRVKLIEMGLTPDITAENIYSAILQIEELTR